MAINVTSPDITTLDFLELYDISGAVPAIILTNNSVVVHAANLTWWYVITTPSGLFIHQGSVTAPDVTGVAWTTLAIPPGSWPTPMGSGPCAQVEFNCASPYITTLYVKDSQSNIFSLAKAQTICAPNGVTANSCGNFGVAVPIITTDCNNAVIRCNDQTNYAYQNQATPASYSNTWTLVYPQDNNGNQPANAIATNTPNAIFNISYNASGYNLYLRDYATYNMGNGVSINIQYKGQSLFNVVCNVDICALHCGMMQAYQLSKTNCGELTSPELEQQMADANYLFSQVLAGILQPSCQIDVPGLILQIEKILDFNSCCCNGSIGINPAAGPGAANSPNVKFGNVINIATGIAPAQCPLSYFPAQVYDPTGTTVIGVANSVNDLVGIINGNAAWQLIGTAFNEGNCRVGFYTVSANTVVPNVIVSIGNSSTSCTGNTQNYVVNMTDLCYPTTPINASSFPCSAWVDFGLGSGPQSLGVISSQSALITALNATTTKPVSITFAAGASTAQVQIINSSCTAYSGTITITCDVGSASFLLYGSSSSSYDGTTPAAGATDGLALRTKTVIGKIPGTLSTAVPWHTIKIGNYLITAEGNTGIIWFWDITNPLSPVLFRKIQLNNVTGTSFTGLPTSTGINGTTGISSFYSLYFVGEYNTMNINSVYIFEGITGTGWQLNPMASGSGITASFHDAALLGKCPRTIQMINGAQTIIFTQDGSLEFDAGLSSGVTTGYITTLLTSNFSSGGIAKTTQVLLNNEEAVWAASFDGVNTIWFTGAEGTLAAWNITSLAFTRHTNGLGFVPASPSTPITPKFRCNSTYYLGNLYVTSLNEIFGLTLTGVVFVNTTTLVATPFQNAPTSEPSSLDIYSVVPLGNCLILAMAWRTSPFGGLILIYNTSGVFLSEIALPANQNIYNVVPIPNIPVYTPTTLI